MFAVWAASNWCSAGCVSRKGAPTVGRRYLAEALEVFPKFSPRYL
jgi:hypothetical protein